jgi:uncharacterized protein (TIGR02266 family)
MSDKANMRKHPRLSPLIIRAQYQGDNCSGESYLLNLSEGGAFLATSEALATDENVRLEISLPWKLGEVRAESRVVWHSDTMFNTDRELPPGTGLEFTNIGPEDRERLRHYVQRFNQLADQIDKEE